MQIKHFSLILPKMPKGHAAAAGPRLLPNGLAEVCEIASPTLLQKSRKPLRPSGWAFRLADAAALQRHGGNARQFGTAEPLKKRGEGGGQKEPWRPPIVRSQREASRPRSVAPAFAILPHEAMRESPPDLMNKLNSTLSAESSLG